MQCQSLKKKKKKSTNLRHSWVCLLQTVAAGFEHLKCAFVQFHTANTESNFQFTALRKKKKIMSGNSWIFSVF